MLLEDFYKVEKIDLSSASTYTAYVRLNKDHDIFKGHFPGKPITPGVCMIQIIKNISSQIIGKTLKLKYTGEIKFLAIINPEVHPELTLSIVLKENGDNTVTVKNVTSIGDTIALKMNATYDFDE